MGELLAIFGAIGLTGYVILYVILYNLGRVQAPDSVAVVNGLGKWSLALFIVGLAWLFGAPLVSPLLHSITLGNQSSGGNTTQKVTPPMFDDCNVHPSGKKITCFLSGKSNGGVVTEDGFDLTRYFAPEVLAKAHYLRGRWICSNPVRKCTDNDLLLELSKIRNCASFELPRVQYAPEGFCFSPGGHSAVAERWWHEVRFIDIAEGWYLIQGKLPSQYPMGTSRANRNIVPDPRTVEPWIEGAFEAKWELMDRSSLRFYFNSLVERISGLGYAMNYVYFEFWLE